MLLDFFIRKRSSANLLDLYGSVPNHIHEGFQTNKEDVCNIVKKGKADISSQLDQASALMTDANDQLAKIKSSLDDVSNLTSSFDC